MEGAGAMPVAAALQHLIPTPGKTALVISGGNIDVNTVSRIIETGLMRTGRRVKLETRMADRPGELVKFIKHLEKMQANILSITHERWIAACFLVKPSFPSNWKPRTQLMSMRLKKSYAKQDILSRSG